MKRSLCQMIAIACIIATGFLTVAPFLQQDVLAFGPSHSYDVWLDTTLFVYCTNCGSWRSVYLGPQRYTFTHADGEDHIIGGYYYLYTTESYCSSCPIYASHPAIMVVL